MKKAECRHGIFNHAGCRTWRNTVAQVRLITKLLKERQLLFLSKFNMCERTSLSSYRRSEMSVYFFTQMKGESRNMNKILKRLLTGVLTLATVLLLYPQLRFMLRIPSILQQKEKQEQSSRLIMAVQKFPVLKKA